MSAVAFDAGQQYDLAIVSIGFERRSSFLLRSGLRATALAAFCFDAVRVGSFHDNYSLARQRKADIVDRPEQEYAGILNEMLRRLSPSHGPEPVRIAVDISSMTRQRLAVTILRLQDHARASEGQVAVDFLYCPARFAEPEIGLGGVLTAGPVMPEFRGRLRRSAVPVGAVIGLGYEPQRALGAFELLEPARAWAFRPRNTDERFSKALDEANGQLLSLLGADAIFEYSIGSGAQTVSALESFVYAMASDYRLVLIPMGPKIFALACLLVGLTDDVERPAVWRVGQARYLKPVEAVEQGIVVGTRVEFAGPHIRH